MTETRLATLTEAAEITGLSVDALRQRIKRRKLAAHRGNDGRVRVRLEPADIEALKADQPVGSTSPPSSAPASRVGGEGRLISLIERLMTPLAEQNEQLKEERRQLRERAQHAESRAGEAEIRAESAAQEANKLRTELAEARDAAGRALREAATLREAAEERDRWGLARRLRWAAKGR